MDKTNVSSENNLFGKELIYVLNFKKHVPPLADTL